MRRLRQFLRRPPDERRLFVAAVALLVGIWLALRLIPFATLRRWISKVRRGARLPVAGTPQKIAWALHAAGRYFPSATCLPHALAAQVLLARFGLPADVKIGVARNAAGRFEAHAWVESGAEKVTGHLPDLARYTPLRGETADVPDL